MGPTELPLTRKPKAQPAGYEGHARWGVMLAFALGAAAACNSLLGYDQNFELVCDDASVPRPGQRS